MKQKKLSLELANLTYAYDTLTPYMSAETLELHHDKHHMAYVINGNLLMNGSDLKEKPLKDIITRSYKNDEASPLFNNVAQHWNHLKFWKWLKPNGGGIIPGHLEKNSRRFWRS
jgi:Fe-Mn family superoxide dismutase